MIISVIFSVYKWDLVQLQNFFDASYVRVKFFLQLLCCIWRRVFLHISLDSCCAMTMYFSSYVVDCILTNLHVCNASVVFFCFDTFGVVLCASFDISGCWSGLSFLLLLAILAVQVIYLFFQFLIFSITNYTTDCNGPKEITVALFPPISCCRLK